MSTIFWMVTAIVAVFATIEWFRARKQADQLEAEREKMQEASSAWGVVKNLLHDLRWDFDPAMSLEKPCRERVWRKKTSTGFLELNISGTKDCPRDLEVIVEEWDKMDSSKDESRICTIFVKFEKSEDLLRFLSTDLPGRILRVQRGVEAMRAALESKLEEAQQETPTPS